MPPHLCRSVAVLTLLQILSPSRCDPEPARAPKVYNALITSSQNLAGSKSFPVYQPYYQDAFGYPFPPSFYYQDYFRDLFGDTNLYPSRADGVLPQQNPSVPLPASPPNQPPPNASPDLPPDDSQRRQGEGEPSPSPSAASDPTVQRPNDPSNQTPPPQPSTQSPIPLNEFGLPPALVPLTPGRPGPPPTYSYDPFSRFNPYFPQFDPYLDPFPFQSYPPLPQVYRFGEGPEPRQPPTEAKPSEAPQPSSSPPADQDTSSVPPAPSDLDVNNYSKKDPSIPDVPPPPVPSGGFKDDPPKTNNA